GELFEQRTGIPGGTTYWSYITSIPPITLPTAILHTGMTKMRIIVRDNQPLTNEPCFQTDGFSYVYDVDVNILCGDMGPPFFPNDLNWCNVSGVSPVSAEISCYDKNGTLTDMRFHYKIIPHD